MATTKPVSPKTEKRSRPAESVTGRSGTATATKRDRRSQTRRIPIEHLGSPSTAVVITGGGEGIGEASALRLAEAGRPVAIWDKDAERADEVALACRDRFGTQAIGVAIDVTHTRELDDAVLFTRNNLGVIGGLVHAAGVIRANAIDQLSDEIWDETMAVNLRAAAMLTKALTPALVEATPGSAIVYVSSMDAFVSNKLVSAYDASKAGLLGLTRSAAHALGPSGIRVNAVCPGYVRTQMTDLLFATEAVIDHIATKIPLLRVAEADDIATVIRFLLSDEAAYVTGSSITVDGGVTSTRTS